MTAETYKPQSNVYRSENANKPESRLRRMGAFAKKIGKAALNFVAPPLGPEAEYHALKDYNQTRIDAHLAPMRQEAERKATILKAYEDAVRQPELLPGQRPDDPAMRRIRKGIYNNPEGWTAQVAVYDQARRGLTRTHQRGVGVTISTEMTFDDGSRGVRRMDFTPGMGTELRVATSDYTTGPNGEPIALHHNASWASRVTGGAEASMEQVGLVQEIMAGNTVWADPVVAASPPHHR